MGRPLRNVAGRRAERLNDTRRQRDPTMPGKALACNLSSLMAEPIRSYGSVSGVRLDCRKR